MDKRTRGGDSRGVNDPISYWWKDSVVERAVASGLRGAKVSRQ